MTTLFSPTDTDLDVGMPPKPTMFLPSITEINHNNAGTYLCLLENFLLMLLRFIGEKKMATEFCLPNRETPRRPLIHTWSSAGWPWLKNAWRKNTYIKHENNKRGKDQEIFLPSVSQGMGIYWMQPPRTFFSKGLPHIFCLLMKNKYKSFFKCWALSLQNGKSRVWSLIKR